MNRGTRGAGLAAVVAATLALCAGRDAGAVVNGTPVETAEFHRDFPWLVALLSPAGGVCGATLISPTWLVTAGHCVTGGLVALIGEPDRRAARRVEVAGFTAHPRYHQAGLYDVGLVRLPEALKVKPLRIATLAESRHALVAQATATILGWGRRTAAEGFSEELIKATIRIGRPEVRESLFLYEDRTAGVCAGDSGGPMVIRDDAGKPLLIGIADLTDGDLCARGGGIAGYTEAAQVMDFIITNVTDLPGRAAAR